MVNPVVVCGLERLQKKADVDYPMAAYVRNMLNRQYYIADKTAWHFSCIPEAEGLISILAASERPNASSHVNDAFCKIREGHAQRGSTSSSRSRRHQGEGQIRSQRKPSSIHFRCLGGCQAPARRISKRSTRDCKSWSISCQVLVGKHCCKITILFWPPACFFGGETSQEKTPSRSQMLPSLMHIWHFHSPLLQSKLSTEGSHLAVPFQFMQCRQHAHCNLVLIFFPLLHSPHPISQPIPQYAFELLEDYPSVMKTREKFTPDPFLPSFQENRHL